MILPWNLYNSPAVITYFLGGLGAILGPLFGIIMADYWVMRRAKVNVPALYRTDPKGTYFFTRGVNFRAVIALVPFSDRMPWYSPSRRPSSTCPPSPGSSAAGLGAVVYLAIAKHGQEYKDVSGEAIAVAPTH